MSTRNQKQIYSVVVTCGSIVLAAVMIAAAAGYSYYQSFRLNKQRSLATPTTLAVPKQMPAVRPVELPSFDPDAFIAEIQAGSNPRDVAASYHQSSPYRVRWTIEGWLSTGQAWGRFDGISTGSNHELAMNVPKGSKIGDKLDIAGSFLSYQLTPSGGMMFSFQASR